jgi:hypothetical protein
VLTICVQQIMDGFSNTTDVEDQWVVSFQELEDAYLSVVPIPLGHMQAISQVLSSQGRSNCTLPGQALTRDPLPILST